MKYKLTHYSLLHIFIILLLQLSFILLAFVLVKTFPEYKSILKNVGLFLQYLMQLSILYYVYIITKPWLSRREELGLYFYRKDILKGLGAAILSLTFAGIYGSIFSNITNLPEVIFFKVKTYQQVLLVINMIIFAPVIEEIVFRGFLWRLLEKKNIKPFVILLITTFLFALIHYEPQRFPILFVGGFIDGYFRLKSGRLGISIAGHMFTNIISLIFILFVP